MHWLDNNSARLLKSKTERKTIGLTFDFKRLKFMVEEIYISGNQTILGKIKSKGGSKILKIWEKDCSYNNWRLPSEHRSLDNFFFEQQTV